MGNTIDKMKILSVILLLTIAATALSVKSQNGFGEKGSLYFYHKYEKNHAETLNPNVPLQKHYSNERHNREALNKIDDEIIRIKRKAGFKERTLKRQELALENERNTHHSSFKGANRIASQHERAIKEEINHQEKFREKYEHRLKKNRNKLAHALPDQVEAYKKLVDFDEDRVKYFTEEEHRQQHELEETMGHDLATKAKSSAKLAVTDGKIAALKAKIDEVRSRVDLETSMLKSKKHHLENVIKEDIKLDKKRRENESIEAKRAEGILGQKKTDNAF